MSNGSYVAEEEFIERAHTDYSFAYVDFSAPEEKVKAIAMSERNLDGRRLLIKDGKGNYSYQYSS